MVVVVSGSQCRFSGGQRASGLAAANCKDFKHSVSEEPELEIVDSASADRLKW